MLLKQKTLTGIAAGSITTAFRRWRRPTVKAGGTLLTSIGQLAIDGVDTVDPDTLSDADARMAGFADAAELRAELARRSEGDVYRVQLRLAGPDPRIALRQEIPTPLETDAILHRLQRIDARSSCGPWTKRALAIIAAKPATRAGDLAADLDMERAFFKTQIRKLKALGLTESLKIGYKLSPRGHAILKALGSPSE